MTQTLAHITLVVADYDEAISFFCTALGFDMLEDTSLGNGKRWVVVRPRGGGSSLLLARAVTPEQRSRIGDQTGGRVGFFLHTDDFQRDFHAMRARGVKFIETPRDESYGRVVVFEDLYGNRWDLVGPHRHDGAA